MASYNELLTPEKKQNSKPVEGELIPKTIENFKLQQEHLINKISAETEAVLTPSELESSIRTLEVPPEILAAVKVETGIDKQIEQVDEKIKALAKKTEAAINKENSQETQAEEVAEQALRDKIQKRRDSAKILLNSIELLEQQDEFNFIEKFNSSTTKEQVQGLEFTVVKSEPNELLIINEQGKLVKLLCNAENAAEVLKYVKESDEHLKGNSYELRSEILKRSNGILFTYEAYTYGDTTQIKGPELKFYLGDASNWTEERQLLHREIINQELQKAKALSERLDDKSPTIYAVRGNTAAGKTTRIKNDSVFQKAIDINGEASGAINPDVYKQSLKSSERNFGREKITHFQSHNEGCMLARKIKMEIAASDSSMIIDQRLNEEKDITELIKESERTGKDINFLDIDSPLELSLLRVLARKPGGADPLPPFWAVAEGYEGVRKNRKALVDAAASNPTIKNYILYANNEQGQPVKVAEKIDGQLKIVAGQEQAYSQALDGNTSGTVEHMRNQIINEEYIDRIKNELRVPETIIKALRAYANKTFEQALTEHSKKIDTDPLTFAEYTTAALDNLENTSRTAKGTVDTSASPDKAQKMAEGLTSETAADLAKNNFKKALELVYENRTEKFKNEHTLRELIESVALTVNSGITKEGVLIRQGADSPKYPYTKVADLEEKMQQFYSEFKKKLADPKEDPRDIAAWVEYRIDLTDHFFADGCGKTAKIISAWVMMRSEKGIADYTMHGQIPKEKARSEYYANAPRQLATKPEEESEEFKKWVDYYKKLF